MKQISQKDLHKYIIDSFSSLEKYAQRFLKIQTMDGRKIPFVFNPIQKTLHQILEEIKSKRLLRVIILKARREGVSTYTAGRFFMQTTTQPNRYAMVIAHEPEASDFLFHIYKRFQMNLPAFLKPKELYNNKKMLEFNTPDGKGLDSAIRIGTAGKEDFGSSQLINYLHLSELSKYPKHCISGLLTSLFQCVPDNENSEIIIESTAKGVGGAFYDMFKASRYIYELYLDDNHQIAYREKINPEADASNIYTSIFIPFFVFPEYKKTPPPDFELTQEEQELKTLYNLTDDILCWRRYAIANKLSEQGNKDFAIKLFCQEYPANPIEAFISSSDSIFDPIKLEKLIKQCKPPKTRYKVLLDKNIWITDDKGEVLVWNEPDPNKQYVVSMDVAEGLLHGDKTSIDVLEVDTGLQVAHCNLSIAPDLAGLLGVYIASRYNEALLVIERNNHGLMAITRALDMEYPYIYAETVIEPPNRPRKRYGWQTSKTSKPLIIDNLKALFRDDLLLVQNADTYKEMQTFVQTETGELEAELGCHDDRVLSIAIGLHIVYNYLNKLKNRKKVPQTFSKINKNKFKPINPTAWN